MASTFYCNELSVSCLYCNGNEGKLHQVILEVPDAILYNFGDYEVTDINEEQEKCQSNAAITSSALPLLFPVVHSETNLSAKDRI